MPQHCTIILDLKPGSPLHGVEAFLSPARDMLYIDVPDSCLAALKSAIAAEVDGLLHDLRMAQ